MKGTSFQIILQCAFNVRFFFCVSKVEREPMQPLTGSFYQARIVRLEQSFICTIRKSLIDLIFVVYPPCFARWRQLMHLRKVIWMMCALYKSPWASEDESIAVKLFFENFYFSYSYQDQFKVSEFVPFPFSTSVIESHIGPVADPKVGGGGIYPNLKTDR